MKIKQNQIPVQLEGKKVHELNGFELGQYAISNHSQFNDDAWFFENPTPGSSTQRSTLYWTMILHDGSRLTDAKHIERLRWAKVLILTLLVLPSEGRKPGPGSMQQLQKQLVWLLSWMSEAGYHRPCELTPDVIKQYLDQLPAIFATRSDDGKIGVDTAALSLATLMQLWNQRRILAKMGIESLARHPFQGDTINLVAKGLATKAKGWIVPIPDEVSIPLLNKAAWFLGTPAEDVLRLLEVVRYPLTDTTTVLRRRKSENIAAKTDGAGSAARLRHTTQFLETFEFSTVNGEQKPWHPPLDLEYEKASERRAARISRIKELWDAVRDSAAIIVQATSGMRVSELLGITAGIDKSTGINKCVRLELSVTGLYEWFVIRSYLSKSEEGLPREVDWVLGMRPIGSNEVPLAVRALDILEQLHQPWRASANTDRLILGGCQGPKLPAPNFRFDAILIDRANVSMQRFINRWLDLTQLPDESKRKTEDNDLVRWKKHKGQAFRTHMLRKAWAQFALACDSRLLPAIQMQFHHLSLAMTEGGYIGHNPFLLDELNSMSTQKTNLAIFEIIVEKSKVTGRMGEQLEQALSALRSTTVGLPTSERWKKAVEWAERNDLVMYFTAHATCCPIRASEMRCHDTSNTPIWLRKAPNYATREPSLCAGCACAIMDKSHEPFWSSRYVESEVAIRDAKLAGRQLSTFREIQFRADQARSILKKFEVDLTSLDAHVATILEHKYAKTQKGSATTR